jgi:threonine aldolase
MVIDLRSDTVTKPTPGMLEAMFSAKVGDDVFEEDPTVQELEEKSARLFGKEAGLYCASGTMCNQIAINILTLPLSEIICDKSSHIYYYEGGGFAFNSGCSMRMVNGNRGRITAQDVIDNINPDNVHMPVTTLVSLENTHNKGGGSIYSSQEIAEISDVSRQNKLKIHLDGARIFNALAETKQTTEELGKHFDTISFCLSKGLGAPVGSVLLSTKDKIKRARRVRKVLGGGMRQAGYLAAAGIYALDHHVSRLKEDHQKAKELGKALGELNYIKEVLPVETNIIVCTLANSVNSDFFLHYLLENKIKAVPFGKNTIRFVTHLDITEDMLAQAIDILKKFKT